MPLSSYFTDTTGKVGKGYNIMSDFKPIETQEQFDEMVKDRVERAKKSAAKEYESQLAELEKRANTANDQAETIEQLRAKIKEAETGKTETEKAMAELSAQVTAEKLAAVKLRAAIDAGLPVEFAERLAGDDEESIKADAEAIKKMVGRSHVAPLAGTENPPENETDSALRNMTRELFK